MHYLGWHICSACGKGSHYMCYTCTYSLCKRCTKNADFVSIRENKGLCGMCKKTIMLIENCAQGDKAAVCSTFLYTHVHCYYPPSHFCYCVLGRETKRGMGWPLYLMIHDGLIVFHSLCYFYSVRWILMTRAAGSIFSRCTGRIWRRSYLWHLMRSFKLKIRTKVLLP